MRKIIGAAALTLAITHVWGDAVGTIDGNAAVEFVSSASFNRPRLPGSSIPPALP
jgi:hypothetical protein